MDDLISRAAAIAWFFRPYSNEEYYSNLDVERALKATPAVDAAPVVRCRNCKHFIDMSGTSYPSYCYKHSTFDADGEFDNAFSVEPNKYCAWGERRESE